jgi:hypothetical protein
VTDPDDQAEPDGVTQPGDEPVRLDYRQGLGIFTVAALVLLACCGGVKSWESQRPDAFWGMFRDSREYPPPDGAFHISLADDDFEHDVLPYFAVRLDACALRNLRYGYELAEAKILYVRFESRPECLTDFLGANALAPSDHRFPISRVPALYQWVIASGNETYDSLGWRVASVDTRTAWPTVYLISTRFANSRS